MEERIRLAEFVSANPYMPEGGWRQELEAGVVRTLPPPSPDMAWRAMTVSSALAACLRRSKLPGRISTGTGIGVEAPEGDHFRLADVVLSLPDKSGRRQEPAVVCLVVPDADAPDADAAARLAVFRRCRTVRDMLAFSAASPVCRVERRVGGSWSEPERVEGFDAAVRLMSLSGSVLLASAYSDLAGPEPDEAEG